MSDILDKIAKVLNQAENASTSEEADAFFKMAQTLSTRYSIDLAVARAHVAKGQKREEPMTKYTYFNSVSRNNKKPYVMLYLAIAENNDVKINVAHNSSYVIPFGMPSDIEVVEAMFAHLSIQMVSEADEFIRTGKHKDMTQRVYDAHVGAYVDKPIDGRVARSNFYAGFIRRVKMRMMDARAEARKAALAESGDETGTSLVLVNKTDEINAFYRTASTARGSWKGSNTSVHPGARRAGDKAGQRARLSGQGSLGKSKALTS